MFTLSLEDVKNINGGNQEITTEIAPLNNLELFGSAYVGIAMLTTTTLLLSRNTVGVALITGALVPVVAYAGALLGIGAYSFVKEGY